ncbi:amidase family protein (plasmid) [Pseudonocardia bannensis]|uniref:Amidase domain-containing protein n=1 Tax=Pseudonocardia bannensis TaxID=630973 RepID=A0A848DQ74_9PSEU|nr:MULTISPECIES: amidase family protein [Pseudonocardia]NMH94987.1 hypothetical protein [Pseudonocardia bannensis]
MITSEIHEAVDRARRLDSWLRAFVTDIAAAPGSPHGPLAGLPIAAKGVRGLASQHTRCLQQAGAVPIGGTAVPRGAGYQTWGYTDRGPTRNPWRADLSPGGTDSRRTGAPIDTTWVIHPVGRRSVLGRSRRLLG